MPIASGVIVPSVPEQQQQLVDRLNAHESIEVSGIGPKGIAVVFEESDMSKMTKLTKAVAEWDDVADLQMAYCNWEDLEGEA